MLKKIVVLDTNVLIYEKNALNKFKDSIITIPLRVIQELDKFKGDGSLGPNVRYVIREIDKILDKSKICLDENFASVYPLNNNSFLHIDLGKHSKDLDFIKIEQNDHEILETVLYFHKLQKYEVKFYSNDAQLRVLAKSFGITALTYDVTLEADEDTNQLYRGYSDCTVSEKIMKRLENDEDLNPNLIKRKFKQNEYCLFSREDSSSKKIAYKFDENSNLLKKINAVENIYIEPRGREQLFALNALMDPNIHFVTLSGKAGTGKTLLAIAAGLMQTLETNLYRNVLISRPTIPMAGNDLGFLPGDINEKMMPWLKPIFDNLTLLFGRDDFSKSDNSSYKMFLDSSKIIVEPLAFIRGRSIPNQYMIIDEAQNLSPSAIKTILTRAGEGTKIVLTGDPAQIDDPYLTELNNGLTQAIEQFKSKGKGYSAHIRLTKGERSPLAELASDLL